eukprot:TRINITY_DN1760_c0_g1_i1.p1 TRINITY_DN1760_c0_g1~~TRINITY_DN1760_c0_g1_i1.p1  ORF type:complete len:109 (-),score=23.42 TRINITY_DN1760_c0_g1_i1:354-680(-)
MANKKSNRNTREILESWGHTDEMIDMLCLNNVGDSLVKLDEEGFECSEDDPLLILSLVPNHLDTSKQYMNGGNYEVNGNWPGGAPPVVGGLLGFLFVFNQVKYCTFNV